MSIYRKKQVATRRESDPGHYTMAACSVFSSYPTTSQPSTYASKNLLDLSERGRRGSSSSSSGAGGFIRDDIMFAPPRCSTPSSMPRSPGPRSGEYLGTSGPAVAHVDRRAALLQDYFKSTNALNRSIMLEKSTVENQHGHSWTILSDSKRDEIVDEHFVPSQVRDQYDERGLTANYGRSRTLSRLPSDAVNGFLSQKTHHYEDIDGISVPLSQPVTSDSKSRVTHRTLSYDNSSSSSSSSSTSPSFSRNKMMSFSIRSKKVSPVANRKTEPSIDFLPLFERDVNDIDNEIDLPDESLINDHVDSSSTDESFTRLRPLRYSFGRKLRSKVDHSQSTSDLTITNLNTDSPSLQDLRLGSSTLDLADLDKGPNPSPDLDPHALMSSSMSSDDTSSILSSQQSLAVPPDHAQIAARGKGLHRVLNEGSFKHPLSRSVRAGSNYMTVTSEMADRRQMFKGHMSRKTQSENNTRENTPVPDEVEKRMIPLIKTESLTETTDGIMMNTTTELVSPMTSPPGSPAAHGPYYSKRESGYISSYGENEASDDDEASPSSRNHLRTKKKGSRVLNVERTITYH